MLRTMCILLIVLTIGCSAVSETPEVTLDHTACAKCGMLVSDYAWSGAIRMADGTDKAFDDPYCLLSFVKTNAEKPAQIWFHDHEGDAWIKAEDAAFVKQQSVRGPMGGAVLAFANRQAAASVAANAAVMSYGELLADKELTNAQ